MTEHVVKCDRCLRRCDRSAAMFALKLPWDRDFADKDLCPECAAALVTWIAKGTATMAEPATTHQPRPEAPAPAKHPPGSAG